jgi:hypothetical protein
MEQQPLLQRNLTHSEPERRTPVPPPVRKDSGRQEPPIEKPDKLRE